LVDKTKTAISNQKESVVAAVDAGKQAAADKKQELTDAVESQPA